MCVFLWIYTNIQIFDSNRGKEGMNLRESRMGGIYGKRWKEETDQGSDGVVFLLKINNMQLFKKWWWKNADGDAESGTALYSWLESKLV